MPDAYDLQIAAVSFVMSVLGLGGVAFASGQFDRNTRKIEARKSGGLQVRAIGAFSAVSRPSAAHAPAEA